MSKDLTLHAVSKTGSKKLFGYADTDQIAKSGGVLVLYHGTDADKQRVQKEIDAQEAKLKEAKESKPADDSKNPADDSKDTKNPADDDSKKPADDSKNPGIDSKNPADTKPKA